MYTLEIYEGIYTKSEMEKFYNKGLDYMLDGNMPMYVEYFYKSSDLVEYENELFKKWKKENKSGFFRDGIFIEKDNQLYRVKFTLAF